MITRGMVEIKETKGQVSKGETTNDKRQQDRPRPPTRTRPRSIRFASPKSHRGTAHEMQKGEMIRPVSLGSELIIRHPPFHSSIATSTRSFMIAPHVIYIHS
jgi:hypothetical protein